MGLLSEVVKNLIQPFMTDIQLLFGDHTVSLIVYGSAATEEYVSKKSDINVLVVFDDEGIQNLQPVQKKIVRWQKQVIRPLFLTESYINQSLDSFPIEFLNMQSAYHVVSGKDVLKSLDIVRQDLRLQCERELKGKLLHLRQGFVMTRGHKGALKGLIKESVGAFTAIFHALLYLKGKDIPAAKQDVIQQTCKVFGLDEELFSTLFAIRQDAAKPSQSELERIVASYIQQIDVLSRQVDEMEI